VSNSTETETLAREFDAVLSVQRRFGLSTLYRLTRRESGGFFGRKYLASSRLLQISGMILVILFYEKLTQ
jgi:hypothetical protein